MSKLSSVNRLTLLVDSESDLYKQHDKLIDLQEDNTVVVYKKKLTDDKNIFVQNRTTIRSPLKDYFDSSSNYRITLRNKNENNLLLESYTSPGLNIYQLDNNNDISNTFQTHSYNDYDLLDNILIRYNIGLSSSFDEKNYDISIFNEELSTTISISEYFYIDNYSQSSSSSSLEIFQIDGNHVSDIGIFYLDSEKKENLISLAGLTCKNNEIDHYSKKQMQCKKTSFWYSQLFTRNIRESNGNGLLLESEYNDRGIHPQLSIRSSNLIDKNSKTDGCNYYMYLELPNQIFLNKFDNEFQQEDNDTQHALQLLAQVGDSDLEKPDYQLNSNEKTMNLIKLNFQETTGENDTALQFNLHKRYINPTHKSTTVGMKNDQQFFNFTSTIFQECPLDFTNVKNPFINKNYGSLLDQFFLNSNDQSFIDIVQEKTFQVAIPAPDVKDYKTIQYSTLLIILLSMVYLFSKIFKKTPVTGEKTVQETTAK